MAETTEATGRRSVNKLTYFFDAIGGLLFGYDLGVWPARCCLSRHIWG